MGNDSSVHKDPYSTNDFELVIRLAKDLEYLLSRHFNATGNGLGMFINTGPNLAIFVVLDNRMNVL